jgi:hypothetical protein
MGGRIFNRRFECRSIIAKNISYPESNPSVAFCRQYLLVYHHLFRNI